MYVRYMQLPFQFTLYRVSVGGSEVRRSRRSAVYVCEIYMQPFSGQVLMLLHKVVADGMQYSQLTTSTYRRYLHILYPDSRVKYQNNVGKAPSVASCHETA